MELSLQLVPETSTAGVISVSDRVFAAPFNEALVHQAVVAYMAGARKGTRAQKTRAEVKGSGSKPWRQKGTGRARAGSIRSPLWRGGGVTFAASPTNHSQKLNKKMYQGALRSILSELVRSARLVVVEQFLLEQPKTRALLAQLNGLNLDKVLIVTDAWEENLFLAARNLHQVEVREVKSLDPVSLVRFDKVLITIAAIKKIEENLA